MTIKSSRLKLPGIFIIENVQINKKYYGYSWNLVDNLVYFRTLLNSNRFHNRFVQYDWNMYGESAFKIYIHKVTTERFLINEIILKENTLVPYGYNLFNGFSRRIRSKAMYYITKEAGPLISKSKTGHITLDTTKNKISNRLTGRSHTAIHNYNISIARKLQNIGKPRRTKDEAVKYNKLWYRLNKERLSERAKKLYRERRVGLT